MKSPILFFTLLLFITCCVFTCQAQSSAGELLGFLALVISIIGIGINIVGRLNA